MWTTVLKPVNTLKTLLDLSNHNYHINQIEIFNVKFAASTDEQFIFNKNESKKEALDFENDDLPENKKNDNSYS